MLVATYERKRDGFDGNDPMQRFGAGSGIYRSTDGGESFARVSEGLPSCKLGRIGLDYFESDPNIVVAIVESEKIAKEPETYSYAGIRGEDADVGAKMVTITKDGPADKAGLKKDDIVVSVDGRVVPSYREMLKEMHKKLAGDTVKLVVSRERKLVDIEVKLENKPKRSGSASRRNSRNDFTGTLGGQAANLQDTQGPNGHEFGGTYLSEDGGRTWKRINSLNPRPMYYSNIQIDPIDRNNIYICGTSLYKSKDGGETFTGDGGSDGIHVDHHALWIDSKDPRHMILGNDGGVHITHDRMEHWDHYNHVAIGQFYHVGVDSNLDYNVYGGLQDNGSWGGPSRGRAGSGPVNTDWFRVGGGDGFVTLVDPEDPNQIYWESQNGGMGRIHLETGARGFIRPRERGKRFRFNWKTPFMLSPHNSQIHYSAGNHVFRSYSKGNNVKRISPEITNTDKGAGSAITESPMEAGILYVGTTDGAVWMTKDGGNNWNPLFYTPDVKEDEGKKKEESKAGDEKKSADADKASSEKAATEKAASDKPESDDPVTGEWEGKMISDRIPEDRANFAFTLKLVDGKVTGEVEGRRGPSEISEGQFNAESGEITFVVGSQRGDREYSGVIKDGKLTGQMSAGNGRFEMPIEATKKKKDPTLTRLDPPAAMMMAALGKGVSTSLNSFSVESMETDDPVSGDWDCVVESENLPGGRIEFTLELKLDDKNKVSGQLVSPMGEVEVTEGTFNPKTNRILVNAESEQFDIQLKGTVSGDEVSGTLEANGELEADFSGKRTSKPEQNSEEAESGEKAGSSSDEPAKEKQQEADSKKAAPQEAEVAKEENDDEVRGTWVGELSSPNG
jgi:photosystem II stability/assembly factor-like uncharacterized protein